MIIVNDDRRISLLLKTQSSQQADWLLLDLHPRATLHFD